MLIEITFAYSGFVDRLRVGRLRAGRLMTDIKSHLMFSHNFMPDVNAAPVLTASVNNNKGLFEL